MRETINLSRDSFELLLRIFDHPRMTVSAGLLQDDFPLLAAELMESRCLVPDANQSSNSIPNEEDASFHELLWDSDRMQHKYFTAGSGWVFVDTETMKRHVIDDDNAMKFFQHSLGIPAGQRVTCLNDATLWHLGAARFSGHRTHIYFVRRLSEPNVRMDFLRAIKREVGKTPAIILYAGRNDHIELGLPIDQALIPFHQLLVRDSDHFSIDENAVHEILSGKSAATESTGGISLRFTTDYRTVYWNGKEYKLTKKQSAIMECLYTEGGRVHKDLLLAEARTNEQMHRIMRNKVDGNWVVHPLWNTLIESDGNGYYRLNN